MADRKPCYVMPIPGEPWFNSFKMGWSSNSEVLNAWMHHMPGCKFHKQRAYWKVPVEVTDLALDFVGKDFVGKQLGNDFEIKDYRPIGWQDLGTMSSVDPSAIGDTSFQPRPYQREDAYVTALHDQWIVGHEMGVGKCPVTILAGRMRGVQSGVIVDGASHRLSWFDPKRPKENELAWWWPGHPRTEVIESVKQAKTSTAPIRIVSYNLLPKLKLDAVPLDFIWFDEVHMLQNAETYWSMAAKALVKMHPHAWRVGLTGTIQPNRVTDIWNLLDTLWPGRFGTWYDFAKAYSIGYDDGLGHVDFEDTNPERSAELAQRLKFCTVRRTMLDPEVAKWLPSFDVRFSWFKDGPPQIEETMYGDVVRGRSVHPRLYAAVDLAREMVQERKKVTLLTHLRESSQWLARACERWGIPVILLTPENTQTPRQRHELIQRAKQEDRCILVSTLHSVMQGIDLTFAPNVIYAEMYERPLAMLQSLKRFHRMSSTMPCFVKILAREGGDMQAEALYNKIKALNSVWRAGTAEFGMESALEEARNGGLTQEELDAMLLSNASEQVFDDFS